MRIIIAGAGEVGIHLARMLSHEEQNIVLMDTNKERLSEMRHTLEALVVVGDPLLIEDQIRAQVADADLFVAVTPDHATNIVACSIAKQVGAKHTIARVNTPEYLDTEYNELCARLGIDQTIYPEELAAEEIASTSLNPWARQYVTLFNGSVVLVGVKVREGASIIGKHLYELKGIDRSGNKFYHIVAIKRDLETIIPSGATCIEPNDLVYFTCTADEVDEVRKLCGKEAPEVKKMVIAGGSRVALQTIKRIPSHIQVCLLTENKEEYQNRIMALPSNVSVFHGDSRDPAFMAEVGLNDTQVFVALTENSEANILACLAAKRYNVYKTIAKEENIDYIPLAYRLDIGTLINKKLLAAGHIYRMLLGQATGSIVFLSMVNAEVAELVVGRNSPLVGRRVKDLKLPENMTLGGMLHNGVPQMIHGETLISEHDLIIVFYHDVSLEKLKTLFK